MQRRMENLLAMSNRLCDAISTDIAALEKGEFGELSPPPIPKSDGCARSTAAK